MIDIGAESEMGTHSNDASNEQPIRPRVVYRTAVVQLLSFALHGSVRSRRLVLIGH